MTDSTPIRVRLEHISPRGSYFLLLEADEGEWEVNITQHYNEHGTRWTMVGASVMTYGLVTDL